ncbi:MAG: formyl transferase [Rhodobacteraceae bacterium]|nr:formyl transferase [Paracoccaceae bacterium]
MKIVVITQDDPFYLPDVLPRLFDGLRGRHEITGCVLLTASPFGKKESTLKKAAKTYRIFGPRFFLHYARKFIWAKLFRRDAVRKSFEAQGIAITTLDKSINNADSLAKIRALEPDLLVSILGNEIFRASLMEVAPILNLHTAPLPRYRGLMPSFWVLRHREEQTAVSIFVVDEGIDSGLIVVQKPVEIGQKTQEDLIRETKALGMDAMVEAIERMASGAPELIENDAEKATYFSFPTREDVRAFLAAGARFF